MSTAHLIHGFIGFGKTTFAKKLAQDTKAIRFNNDELMVLLYGNNPKQNYFQTHYNKIEALIWSLAKEALDNGIDVIIDNGFWSRQKRDQARQKIKNMGHNHKLYSINCSFDIALQRTLKRTQNDNELFIDENAFNKFKPQFEPMQKDEEFVSI